MSHARAVVGSSSRPRRQVGAWSLPQDRADRVRAPEVVCFAAFGFLTVTVPGIGLPVNETFPMAMVLIALGRASTSPRRTPPWFLAGLLGLLGFLALTSYLHDLHPVRRLVHLTVYVCLAAFLASGRIHVPSAARGIAVGLVASCVLSIAGFGPDDYAGRLTGYLGDPNAGGYVLTTLGVLAVGLTTDRRLRLAVLLVVPVAVGLTLSRTSLLAAAFTVVWLMIGRRVGTVLGVALVAGMVYVVGHIPAQLKTFGPFADRTGSDQLRQRIIALEHQEIAQSPLIGSGAGTAHVQVGQDTFFYHSSYLALQREGGMVAVVLFVTLVTLVFLRATSQPKAERSGWVEASLICLMMCAVNLGEVLLELPGAVALGMVMWHLLNHGPPRPVAPSLVDPATLQVRRRRRGPVVAA